MRMNFTFRVTARCAKFDRKSKESDLVNEKEDIELDFDIEKSMKFLMRFFSNGLIVDDYKILFKLNPNGSVQAISMFKGDYAYIVLNLNQFINDILKGYNYLITMSKVVDIMECDFAALQNKDTDIEEEF